MAGIPDNFLASFPNLEILDVSNTSLDSLSNSSLNGGKLRKLLASSNNLEVIKALTFINSKTLVELDLSNNRPIEEIENFAFYGLSKLETLNLNDNAIDKVDHYTFHNLTSLKFLTVANNKIYKLGPSLFHTNKKLQNISFNGNQIREIDFKIFKNLINFTIDLRGNICVRSKFIFVNGSDNWDSQELKKCHNNFQPQNVFTFQDRKNPNESYEVTFLGVFFLAGLVGFVLFSWRCRGW